MNHIQSFLAVLTVNKWVVIMVTSFWNFCIFVAEGISIKDKVLLWIFWNSMPTVFFVHCQNCQKRLDTIQSVGEKARKINIGLLFNILDNFDARKLRSGSQEESSVNENVIAIVTSSQGKKKVITT